MKRLYFYHIEPFAKHLRKVIQNIFKDKSFIYNRQEYLITTAQFFGNGFFYWVLFSINAELSITDELHKKAADHGHPLRDGSAGVH